MVPLTGKSTGGFVEPEMFETRFAEDVDSGHLEARALSRGPCEPPRKRQHGGCRAPCPKKGHERQ